jgi:alkanesulfonate monooxygenase SsuD/methylene tetrahydromethanopterin reductase-like flavin-dependent oxidoreductase (luciferase family)
VKVGYFLSSEEWGPRELVSQAVKAQEAGFEGLWISDHYHPWNDEQGHSSFVWATIGGDRRGAARWPIRVRRGQR